MDRLSPVALALLVGLAPACDGGEAKPAPSRSRFEAVEAAAPAEVDLAAFCEVMPEPEAAPVFAWPALREGAAPPPGAKKRWVNVWATWCKPCIEELPRLTQWRDELQARVPYELVFLSADAEAPEVETFAKAHPEVAGTLQLQDAEGLVPWTQGLGLPGTPMLPVHLFVDERDRVRCIRTAGIGEDDRAAIEQLMVSM